MPARAMDTSMMIGDGQQQRVQSLANRRMMAPQFDLSLSLFSNTGIGYSLPFQSTSFSCHAQTGPIAYEHFSSHVPPPSTSLQPSLTISHSVPQFARAGLGGSSAQYVKPEVESPKQHTLVLPSDDKSLAQPNEDTKFKTDVDTLMRAIQTKSSGRSSQEQSLMQFPSDQQTNAVSPIAPGNDVKQWDLHDIGGATKSRKRYQCHITSCAKCFFQKTHLEIHMRAHTGYKPFVSRSDRDPA